VAARARAARLKLLLDEMYPHAIAGQLRARGHDVVAVTERHDLRGLPDRSLFAAAVKERRVLVTDDLGFRSLDAERRSRGEAHPGLVFTSNKRFPRGQPRTIGRLVRALDRFLSTKAAAIAKSPSFTHWLT
jgi:predicted nuclease of predicted toxin-antitoxin system